MGDIGQDMVALIRRAGADFVIDLPDLLAVEIREASLGKERGPPIAWAYPQLPVTRKGVGSRR
jgi:hypothetical protein